MDANFKLIHTSNTNSYKVVHGLCKKIQKGFCVDIGAGDGINQSNVYNLIRLGWAAYMIEGRKSEFEKLAQNYESVGLIGGVDMDNSYAKPHNIVSLMEEAKVPKDFQFLNIDVDGYDYGILEKILKEYHPDVICAGAAEFIPPPICFAVKYYKNYKRYKGHFAGCSLQALAGLCGANGYKLVKYHYNNAFFVDNHNLEYQELSTREAYKKGYVDRTNRKEMFPGNKDVECLLTMSPEKGVEFLERMFESRKPYYYLYV